MANLLLMLQLFVFLFATKIIAFGSNSSTTATSTLSSTTTSQYHPPSTTTSIWSSITPAVNTTTVHQPSLTVEPLTHNLPQSISDLIFPTNFHRRPILPSDIPSGKWGLPQSRTNGRCLLGTIGENGRGGAPKFGPFIGANGNNGNVPKTFPWGSKSANNTNPYNNPPSTGVVRKYNFVVERAKLAPDGVERDVIVINGQFPGPTIEANWGDTIEVTVVNQITGPAEGTALHWHGLLQKGTPYEDGVPGVTQCPIAPGHTFTYSFQADLYGSSWYHAHYSAQYAAGLFGAMIIHGPNHVSYDEDLGPVLLSDYYHGAYFDILKDVMGTDLNKSAPFSNNNLINGKGTYNCSLITDGTPCTPNAGYAKFQFVQGKSYRLRLINAGAEAIQKFSIDNHKLTVIAYDFVPIVPYTTEIVTLGVGQRADVIVEATGAASDVVWMRSVITKCSLTYQPDGYAMIYYQDADMNSQPQTSAWPDNTDICLNDDLRQTVPYFSITPPATPATEVSIDLNFGVNATGHLVWTMNNSTFRTDYNNPVLPRAQAGDPSFEYPAEWNVYDFGNASSIRIIVNNLSPVGHPMHIHGHNMYLLADGTGEWDGTIVNPQNPMRRDVHMLGPANPATGETAYMVFQIDSDNPGVWPFHCHIAWHVSGGLYVNILVRLSLIESLTPPLPLSLLLAYLVPRSSTGPVSFHLRKKLC